MRTAKKEQLGDGGYNMKVNFNSAFNNFKNYISDNVPELGRVITHWEDPFTVSKNQTVILPHGGGENNGKINFSIRMFISTVEKNSDSIPQVQMSIMNNIFASVYNSNLPSEFIEVSIGDFEYYDPLPQSPLVGAVDLVINFVVELIDDCF